MSCDRQHRHPAAIGVEQAVDEVKVSRSAARRHYGQLAGDRRLTRGSKCRRFFMADVLPREVAVAAQRVGKAVQRVAREPVNAAHSGSLQGGNDVVGDGWHVECS